MKHKITWLLLMTLMVFPLLHAGADEPLDLSKLYKAKDVEAAWDESAVHTIDLNTAHGDAVTIAEQGDYLLRGSLQGQVVVDAPKDAKVRLILDGVTITSAQGPAIYEKQADKLMITLAEKSANSLTDGPALTEGEDTINAVLYAEDDLSINGTGTLQVNGTQKHGIQSKADVILAGGIITVTAVQDGIRGRNSLLMLNGDINITCGGDGMAVTRTDDAEKGWVILADGKLTVKTGSGAGEAKTLSGGKGGFGRGGSGRGWQTQESPADDTPSQKGVKAATTLTVLGGQYSFDCADDGFHGTTVTLQGGTMAIQTGDDAVHADKDLTVQDGVIVIPQCYEGLEGENVTVSGGDITIVSSDDALNAAGGNDGSGFGGRGGWAEADNGGTIAISGGNIAIHAGGDGLDSNGSIVLSGGKVCIWAASSTGEGAIDFNGTGTLSGTALMILSTGGVMRDAAALTGQSMMAISAAGKAGLPTVLTAEDGTELAAFTPAMDYDTVMISAPQLTEGTVFAITGGNEQLFAGAMSSNTSDFGGSGFGRQRNRKGK
ncbi:MAG: carbohydrate-binding domain-containing protein [Clostridia bacterium]|nr:carbohydrate-binding domain-containing protein [Clostridia bacterium]